MAYRNVENRELTAPRIPDKDEGRGSSPRGPTAEPPFQTAWKGVFALLSGTEASPDGVSLENSRDRFDACRPSSNELAPRQNARQRVRYPGLDLTLDLWEGI